MGDFFDRNGVRLWPVESRPVESIDVEPPKLYADWLRGKDIDELREELRFDLADAIDEWRQGIGGGGRVSRIYSSLFPGMRSRLDARVNRDRAAAIESLATALRCLDRADREGER